MRMFGKLTWFDKGIGSGDLPADFPVWSGKNVGGTTLHWTGSTPRIPEAEITPRRRFEAAAKAEWEQTPIATSRLMLELDRVVDSDAELVSELISSDVYPRRYLTFDHTVPPPQRRRQHDTTSGVLGWGVAAAIGTKIGNPHKRARSRTGTTSTPWRAERAVRSEFRAGSQRSDLRAPEPHLGPAGQPSRRGRSGGCRQTVRNDQPRRSGRIATIQLPAPRPAMPVHGGRRATTIAASGTLRMVRRGGPSGS